MNINYKIFLSFFFAFLSGWILSYPAPAQASIVAGNPKLYFTGSPVEVGWFEGTNLDRGDAYTDNGCSNSHPGCGNTVIWKMLSPRSQELFNNSHSRHDCNPASGGFTPCNPDWTTLNLNSGDIGQVVDLGRTNTDNNNTYSMQTTQNTANSMYYVLSSGDSDFDQNWFYLKFWNLPYTGAYTAINGIMVKGGVSLTPENPFDPENPTNTTSPEPQLKDINCTNNKGSVIVNWDTAGFSSTTTYAIRFVHGSTTEYVQADGSLSGTEVYRLGSDWANTAINPDKQSLLINQEYFVSISAKPDGTGTALPYYDPPKSFTITSQMCQIPTDPADSICGNNIIEGLEQCDDGNTTDNDGCDHNCNNEPATPSNPPTVDIKANNSDHPAPLPNNSTVTLSWISDGADSCTATGNWSGSKSTSGSENQGPLTTGSYTYTIQCTNSAGSASDSVTVQILSPCDINYYYIDGSTDSEVSTITNHWYGTVCINRNIYIASGNTLTIDPGTVVKIFNRDATVYPYTDGWRIDNRGIINANGTADQPIFFTSYRDDSIGNDVSTGSSTPQKSDWRYILFEGGNGPTTGTFNYTTFRYGGSDGSYPIVINRHNNQTTPRTRPVFRNCTFENNNNGGIRLFFADILAENITFKNNSGAAIFVAEAGNYDGGVELLGDKNTAYNNNYNGIVLDHTGSFYYGTRTFYNDLPYIITGESLSMYYTSSLNIESGAIVKFNGYLAINAYGVVNTIGNQYPTYFTSIKDDDTGKEVHPEWFENGICKPHYPCDTSNDGTATTPAPGDWTRLNFTVYDNNANYPATGLLDNCVVRYGGSRNGIDGGFNDGGYSNIYIKGHNNYGKIPPILKNITLANSLYYGLAVNQSAPTLGNISIINSGGTAIYQQGIGYGTNINFLEGNTYNIYNNGINGIRVHIQYGYGQGHIMDSNQTWYNKMPYYLDNNDDMTISSNNTLTIQPGTIIKNTRMWNANGNIIANGTNEQPIYFTSFYDDNAGAEMHPEWFENGTCKPHYPCDTNNDGTATVPAAGNWEQVLFNASSGPAFGYFSHTIFRYGGSGNDRDGLVKMLGFNTNSKTEPILNNCTFEYSQNHGIEIEGSNPTITNPTIRYNTDAAIYLYSFNNGNNVEFPESNQIDVHDNGVNGIETYGDCYVTCGTATINNNRTWYNDLPYVIGNSADVRIPTTSTLTIEPGTVIKNKRIDSSEKFLIYGTLNASGTEEEPIIFTSFHDDLAGTNGTCEAHEICDTNNDGIATTPAKGNWYGLYFDSDSASPTISNLDYVNIKYANNGLEFRDFNDVGQSEPILSHINISEGLGDGVYVYLSSPTLQNMSITNNNGSAIRLAGVVHGNNVILDGNNFDVHDNAINGIHVDIDWGLWQLRGYVESPITFYNQLPYYLDTTGHTITVNSGVSLDFEPGTILKFKSLDSDQKYINNYGILNLNGTTENPIYFTSDKDDAVGIETHPDWFSDGVCKPHYPCDTSNDGITTIPAKEDWGGILYSGSNAGGKVDHVIFRYGAGGTGNYNYELAFDGVTTNTVEITNSRFNFTNTGLFTNNSKTNIRNNIFQSLSDVALTINNPQTGIIVDSNRITDFDTGISLTNISRGLNLTNNYIFPKYTGVLASGITSNGVNMSGNYVNVSEPSTGAYIQNNSTFTSGSCDNHPSIATTIEACNNTWGEYPVHDIPPRPGMYKNPGNIIYSNYGVNITSPAGGESWPPRTNHNITWTTYNTGGNSRYADLYYSLDNGNNWNLIAQNIDHQGGLTLYGNYAWSIPNLTSAQARVKINIKDLNSTILATDQSELFGINYGSPQLQDILSTSRTSQPAIHNLYYTNDLNNASVLNGSLKITIDNDFDFTNVVSSDISITGGDVVWGTPTVNQTNRTIVYPFTGNFNKDDGTLHIIIGTTHLPLNPASANTYPVSVGIYASVNGTGQPVEQADTTVNINNGLIIDVSIPSTMTFTINPVPSGTNVNGAATNLATTTSNELNFGKISGGENKIASHRLNMSTNVATGYTVLMKYTGPLSSEISINDFTGTNSEPSTWLVPNSNGYFGYTTSSSQLLTPPHNRFTSNGGNKWAGFNTYYQEVAGANGPVESEDTYIGYRLNLAESFGVSGVYGTEIVYLATASY